MRLEQFFHGTAPKPSLDQIHNAIFGFNQESTGRKLMDDAKDETVHALLSLPFACHPHSLCICPPSAKNERPCVVCVIAGLQCTGAWFG